MVVMAKLKTLRKDLLTRLAQKILLKLASVVAASPHTGTDPSSGPALGLHQHCPNCLCRRPSSLEICLPSPFLPPILSAPATSAGLDSVLLQMLPQHLTPPSEVIAQVRSPPAAMAMTERPGRACGVITYLLKCYQC